MSEETKKNWPGETLKSYCASFKYDGKEYNVRVEAWDQDHAEWILKNAEIDGEFLDKSRKADGEVISEEELASKAYSEKSMRNKLGIS